MTEKIIVSALLLGAVCTLCAFACQMSGWTTSHGRMLNVSFPWTGKMAEINSVATGWMVTADDSMMKGRSFLYCFPQAEIRLSGDVRGEAELFVRFVNGQGNYAGDTVSLPFKDGRFKLVESFYYKTEGDKAVVKCLDGFKGQHEMAHHRNAEDEALWCVEVYEKESGKSPVLLGRVSVEPNRTVAQ